MSRSTKKGPNVVESLYRKVERLNTANRRQPIKTWARACTIVPEFVGHTFQVHNGRAFPDVFVTEDMVGHKLGEFSHTRIFRGHTNKKEGVAADEGGGGGPGGPRKGGPPGKGGPGAGKGGKG
jgi:small subunit ribosomal protein S19